MEGRRDEVNLLAGDSEEGRTAIHCWAAEDEKGGFGGLSRIAGARIPEEPGARKGGARRSLS